MLGLCTSTIYIYAHTSIHTDLLHIIDTYVLAYLHTYIPTTLHTSTYLRTYVRTYIPTYMHTYIHTYIHTCMHVCMHACMHACMRICVRSLLEQFERTPKPVPTSSWHPKWPYDRGGGGNVAAQVLGPQRHHKAKDPAFWFQGPGHGGSQKPWFVESLPLCGLLGPSSRSAVDRSSMNRVLKLLSFVVFKYEYTQQFCLTPVSQKSTSLTQDGPQDFASDSCGWVRTRHFRKTLHAGGPNPVRMA